MQRICILLILAFICHETIQEDGGRNDGEPEYDSEGSSEESDEGENISGKHARDIKYSKGIFFGFKIVGIILI